MEISITTYVYVISKISKHFNNTQQKNFIVSVFLHSFFHKNIENSKLKNNQYYFSLHQKMSTWNKYAKMFIYTYIYYFQNFKVLQKIPTTKNNKHGHFLLCFLVKNQKKNIEKIFVKKL